MDKIQGLVITHPNMNYIKKKASYYTNLKKTLMFAVRFLIALPLTSVLPSKMCQTWGTNAKANSTKKRQLNFYVRRLQED